MTSVPLTTPATARTAGSRSRRRAGGAVLSLGLAVTATVLAAGPALAAPSSQDATWLRAAHQYNLTEISAGSAAQTRAYSGTVKSLGAMFVKDHTSGDAGLRALAARLGVSLPTTPDATQRTQLAQAAATSGRSFDALFLSQQTLGHRQALAAGSYELAHGSDSSVLALARATAPVVQKHLSELLAAQGSSTPTSASAGTGGQVAGDGTSPAGRAAAGLGIVLLVGAGATGVRRARARA